MSAQNYIELSTAQVQLISVQQAWRYGIIPISSQEHALHLIISEEKSNCVKGAELEALFGKQIELEVKENDLVKNTLHHYYRRSSNLTETVTISDGEAQDFLSNLIRESRDIGSSDIHFECFENKARIRIRIDGILIERYELKISDYPALVNKIKIRAKLDIAEKRLPQDGRLHENSKSGKIDIRVSILPTLYGERVVLRLLSNDAERIDLKDLGLSRPQHEEILKSINFGNGIILISGPTGSGKTTTLYAALKILNEDKRSILTAEDPIEYTLPGINQVQVRESIGFTFANALRSFMRQNPDVMMVGEIRDAETANMAIRAALTGHLVLSTIHTNSAWGTISRLIDLGVPSYLISDTLRTTVAQRLVRLLCPNCKRKGKIRKDLLRSNSSLFQHLEFEWFPVGCTSCHFTGFKGRKAVYEVIRIDKAHAVSIRENHAEPPDSNHESFVSLQESALKLVSEGLTSMEEVMPILIQ